MAPAKPGSANIRRALIAAAAAIVAIQVGAAAAQSQRDPHADAEDAISRLALQTEVKTQRPAFRIYLPAEMLWVVVAIALGLLLYAFRDAIPLLRSRASESWAEDDAIAADVMRKDPAMVPAAADELAGQGRYAEAMHVLLLRSLADMRARLDEPFADSLTSREILRSPRLPETARAPLQDVVGRVEFTYFGEYPAAHDDYVACRASFSALEAALHASAAA
jgi:hypothetical protein